VQRPTEKVQPPPQCSPGAAVWRTLKPSQTPQAGDVWVNPRDGMRMVYVASGEFTLGTSDAQLDAWLKEHPTDKRCWFNDEQPQCRVSLPGDWIGRTKVTNAQYERFVQATGHCVPPYWEGRKAPSGLAEFPVVSVSWDDASAYCAWARGHLPTELQWEKAARGGDGRVFPWGNQWDPKRCRNFEMITGRGYLVDPLREGSAAVGSYPAGASPYGCEDMAGNVWEWCADWYESDAYKRYAKGDLTPPPEGYYRLVRGGSWDLVFPKFFRCACRYFYVPDFPCINDYVGFRCARRVTLSALQDPEWGPSGSPEGQSKGGPE